MTILILISIILAILDTLIGNRIFPSKIGIVRCYSFYYVYKYNRFFFIPIKCWLSYNIDSRHLLDFGTRSSRERFNTESDAIKQAKRYSNQLQKTIKQDTAINEIEIWSSKGIKAEKL